ncbi:adenine deaminase C-terminal domain-containing protein [Deinococcus sp. UYEF24]
MTLRKADLLIFNARIVDVVRLRTYLGWVSVVNGALHYVEEGTPPAGLEAGEITDLGGQFLVPGLIDAHMHIESSLLTPRRFQQAVLPHGTTTVLADPHELANVFGPAGVSYTLEASEHLALRVYVAVPSCVPATDFSLETSSGQITVEDVSALAAHPRVIALGEVMDYQGLASPGSRLPALIRAAQAQGLLIEGHTPTLNGAVLSDYAAYGVLSDHTLSTPAKLLEQLTKGFTVMLQEKSLNAEVVDALLGLPDRSRVLLVTDDVMPNRLLGGHLSLIVRSAVRHGLDVLEAIAMATLRPASYLGLRHLGVIAPGRQADLLVVPDLAAFRPVQVLIAGKTVYPAALALPDGPAIPGGGELSRALSRPDDFRLPVDDGPRSLAVISMNAVNTFTTLGYEGHQVSGGALNDPGLTQVAVLQRAGTRPPSAGLLRGLGLRSGAFATTLAHDSHNLLVFGQSAGEMSRAANLLIRAGGGMVFLDGEEEHFLPLEIGGVVSDAPVAETAALFDRIESALRRRGVIHLNPLLFLSIFSLSVSPAYKITDLGLLDVERRRLIPLKAPVPQEAL